MEIATIKSICAKYGIYPSKRYGQNFLVDERVPKKMCEAAQLNGGDFVVEVGPGLGALTFELAKRVKKVLAVEVDKKMVEALREVLQSTGLPSASQRVELVHGDILKISNQQLVELFQNPSSFPSPVLSDILSRGERGG